MDAQADMILCQVHVIVSFLIHVVLSCTSSIKVYGPCGQGPENQILLHANNKYAEQPAHPCSVISNFIICSLKSI